jgi:hypothetical protein
LTGFDQLHCSLFASAGPSSERLAELAALPDL